MTHPEWLSLSALDQAFPNRRALVVKLMTAFVKTYERFPADMQQLINAGDLRGFAVQLHSLKGASASLRADALHHRTAELEAGLKNESKTPQDTLNALMAFWPEVMQNARDILEALTQS